MDEIYRTYFKKMPCFLSVQDRNLNLIEANDSFRKNFGDWEGRKCYQVYKQRPEKCEVCPVERTLRDGQPHTSEEWVTTRDGRETAVIVNTTPLFDDNGKIVAVMEMSTDITENKLLQKQFKDSQEKYRLLFEDVPCYISIQDMDLSIIEANRLHRETFGTSYGDKCYEIYIHRDKECFPCIVRKTFSTGEVLMHEEVVTSRKDETINVLVCTAPVRNSNGEIESVMEMSTDITQIRKLQDKLSAVGLLIGTISHTIKGLLNGLDGGIYLVNTGLKKDDRERIDRGWEMALRNVDRIRSMVMDILYYAKDREPDWQVISASDLIEDICGILGDKAAKLKIELVKKIDPDIGKFEADLTSIRSLFINLLENSLDACRTDRKKTDHRVEMALGGTPDEIIFKMSDNGVGMTQETREKAFSLFFSSKGAGGTGLGLFIANKIAQAHGGFISIESGVDVGSVFTVKLPREKIIPITETDKGDTAELLREG